MLLATLDNKKVNNDFKGPGGFARYVCLKHCLFYIACYCKYRMGKTERIHDANNHDARGAELCHGMIRRNEGRGVIRDSRPSLTWYARLLR